MAGIFGLLLSGAAQAVKDTYFNLVSLLLPGNGTNGATNNSFLDSSSNAFTVTRNGNTTQGSFSPFSQTGWGNYFIASSGLRVPHTTDFDFSTGDFTVESFIYPVSAQANNNIVMVGALGSGFGALILKLNVLNKVELLMSTAGSAWNVNQISTSTVSLNTWSHIAVVRNGSGSNNLQVYVNGTSYISTTYTSSPVTGGSYEYIATNGTDSFLGYISNARIVKGQALSTGTFTPPTAPISSSIVGWTGANAASSITGTVPLVTCQSNRFVDTSSSPKTITVLGSPSVVAFSPFAPTAAYTTSVVGGSGYFDGNGDYLEAGTASNWTFLSNTTALFSIEAWVYLSSAPATLHPICFTNAASSANVGFGFWINSSRGVGAEITIGSTGTRVLDATTTGTIQLGAWNYVAITYDQSLASGNCKIYINNAAAETFNKTGATPSSSNPATTLLVGRSNSSTHAIGYYSSLRISNVIRTITLPTAPYTNDANTSLLLNFTNGAIFDATAKNDLETVGDAQISRPSPFGTGVNDPFGANTGTMKFDGTGDWLKGVYSPNMILSGDFTIECWLYYTAHGSYGGIVSFANSNTASAPTSGWAFVFYAATDKLYFETGTGFSLQTTNTVSSGTWNHVAVVRSGSTITHYLNGTANGSGSSSATFAPISTDNFVIGVDRGLASTITGYISNLRITRYARYTSNFTAPTAPFPVQ